MWKAKLETSQISFRKSFMKTNEDEKSSFNKLGDCQTAVTCLSCSFWWQQRRTFTEVGLYLQYCGFWWIKKSKKNFWSFSAEAVSFPTLPAVAQAWGNDKYPSFLWFLLCLSQKGFNPSKILNQDSALRHYIPLTNSFWHALRGIERNRNH